jgi:hypothetical protein
MDSEAIDELSLRRYFAASGRTLAQFASLDEELNETGEADVPLSISTSVSRLLDCFKCCFAGREFR